MNSVRWILYQRAMARFQGVAEVHMTYGVISKRVRTNLGLPYSCATDAYCMGELRPEARCETEVFQKYRRNNRVLSKFYDAKYYDTREKGVIRSGNELSSGRTNRNHNLDGEICAGSVAVRSQRAEPRPESRDMPCSREISWSTAIANTFPRAAPAMAGH